MGLAHIPSDRLRGERIFAYYVVFQPGIGLQRCRQCEMRGEGVIDVGYAAGCSIIGHPFGRSYSANAAAINLHVGDLAIVDELSGHVEIVGGLTAGNADLAAAGSKCGVGVIGASKKWFFKPNCIDGFKHGDAGCGAFNFFSEYLAGINEQGSVMSQSFAGRLKVIPVILQRAAAEGSPTAFDSAKAFLTGLPATCKRFGRRVAEELRGIGQLWIGLLVSQEFVDWHFALSSEQIP